MSKQALEPIKFAVVYLRLDVVGAMKYVEADRSMYA